MKKVQMQIRIYLSLCLICCLAINWQAAFAAEQSSPGPAAEANDALEPGSAVAAEFTAAAPAESPATAIATAPTESQATAPSADQSAPIRLAALNSTTAGVLTPGAREVAVLLGILPKVERLMQLSQSRSQSQPMSDEEMGLKVDVLDHIMGGSLEVRMISGRIDREVAWAFSGQGMLQAKRQKILNYLFAANFMQGGMLGIFSGPSFLHGYPKMGTELLLLGSSIGLGLSLISFVEARSGSKKMDSEVTVLADVYGLNPPEPLHKPQIVTKYMNSVPPESSDNKTRVQILMARWQKSHTLSSTEERTLRKMSAYQPAGEQYRENISLLAKRIRMLFDTQWTLEQLDADLLELLRATDIN